MKKIMAKNEVFYEAPRTPIRLSLLDDASSPKNARLRRTRTVSGASGRPYRLPVFPAPIRIRGSMKPYDRSLTIPAARPIAT